MWSRFSSSTVQKNDAVDASTIFGGQTSEEGTPPGQRGYKGDPWGRCDETPGTGQKYKAKTHLHRSERDSFTIVPLCEVLHFQLFFSPVCFLFAACKDVHVYP